MYEATALSGPNALSAGAPALAMLCAQKFKLSYEAVTERAGCNLSSTRHEAIVRRTKRLYIEWRPR
jgi:hypothetical protein